VADHLKMPSLTQVVKMDVEDGKLRCERQAEYGYDTVSLSLPAVIAVGDAINEPRYPSLKAIMGAKKKPLDTKSAGDVGIDAGQVGEAGSQTTVVALNPPPAKEAGEIIEDEDTNETVEKIVACSTKGSDLMAGSWFTPCMTMRATSTRTPQFFRGRAAGSRARTEAAAVIVGDSLTKVLRDSATTESPRSTARRTCRRAWPSRSST
jgi:hypothetical protein